MTRICIIGSGNVATHLAKALDKDNNIVQIYSHTYEHAWQLGKSMGHPEIATDRLDKITDNADIYIVSVKDDSIATVLADTPDKGIWVHTSGSIPMEVFNGHKTQYGVFYPLQTFSKHVDINMSRVPFFIEGNAPETYHTLETLARNISDVVEPADSKRRKALHIAAVFACNFVNYMWTEADELLRNEGLNINYLRPLLEETLGKIGSVSPADAQTGPARRGDTKIISEHLSQLTGEKREI
ncbi:MAG: DUF2520 domain-containing protein [Muribaculaceae bacterium]|nr:DUF2520 domain-containing protein [Muribaculaceae bacterium]